MQIIDGNEIYSYIVSGAKNVIVNENNLNRINVFPVPDGDTGTNLCLTMNSILTQAQRRPQASVTMKSIADVAVDHAYGNSGVIFAQYLHGLSQSVGQRENLTSKEFVESLKTSAQYAFKSVANPKEGTILTVMREWAVHLESHIEEDFAPLVEHSLSQLRGAVQHTKDQLKVLRDHNVVDAGAMAFYYFVEGIAKFLKTRTLENQEYTAAVLEEVAEIYASSDVGDYRYCTQYLIQTKNNPDTLREKLGSHGDSLVIGSTDDHLNVHLHTNAPHEVMKLLLNEGPVTSHKVDDMYMQAHLIHEPVSKMVIVTDSIADLPQEFVDRHQIVVIPMNIIIDSVVYMDKVTMKQSDFYEHMDDYTLNPTSSMPTQTTIERTFRQLLQHYDQILGIFVSSKMSGTYANLLRIVEPLRSEGKQIEILDSKVNSIAEGLLVYEAAMLKQQGVPFEEIVETIQEKVKKAKIYVSVKDLKYMLKGGRVSKTTGFILSKLKLQPVISIDPDGKGEIFAKSLTQKSALKSILKTIKNDLKKQGIDKYALVYSDNPEDLDELKKQCLAVLGKEPEYIESISPIVGLNAGKGAFAVGYILK